MLEIAHAGVPSIVLMRLLYAPVITSGLLLGMTMAAMLLGHWYLNAPDGTRAAAATDDRHGRGGVLQAIVSVRSACGGELTSPSTVTTQGWFFLLLRWSFGLIGVAILTWMTWQTLEIPNTQSATGILYVAVIGTFVGETMALLLSAESLFPL